MSTTPTTPTTQPMSHQLFPSCIFLNQKNLVAARVRFKKSVPKNPTASNHKSEKETECMCVESIVCHPDRCYVCVKGKRKGEKERETDPDGGREGRKANLNKLEIG